MRIKLLRFLYFVYVCLTALACLIFIGVNLQEIIERAQGHDTYISQMYGLTARQSVRYSAIYLLPFLIATVFGIYFFFKSKRKAVLLLSLFVWALFFIQGFTDALLLPSGI